MAATRTALVSSNPRAFSGFSSIRSVNSPPSTTGNLSQTLALPRNFHGLRRSFEPFQSSCLIRASRVPRRNFVANAVSEEKFPLVGNLAPDFEAEAVFDQEFVEIKLSDYIGKKHVILFFYPLDFTFVCPTEIIAFSDRHSEFEKVNTQILGVSIDSKGIALRGLFIIDKEGMIQHSTINNLAIGRSVDETMRTLQAVQYVQENPDEVCPAGWKPGEKSMKPDPKLSKEYFAAI